MKKLVSTGKWPLLAGLAVVAGAAYAATQISVNEPIALSDGTNGDKPKIQRAGDGTLIVVYGDSPDGAGDVYDVKAAVERKARDIFVKTCKPDATKTCDNLADWSPAANLSRSALLTSIQTEWRGTIEPGPKDYPGDIDKPNVKQSGSVLVVTWVSKYCPDGDPTTPEADAPAQRAVRYLTRDSRVIPFSCTWAAYTTNNGGKWSDPVQLSSGLRDAIQDSSGGAYNSETKKGQVVITWQEDPHGLLLGEGDGPGDGASGATVNGGTDVWYTRAAVDLAVAGTPLAFAGPVRVTDNWQGLYGPADSKEAETEVVDGAGALVDTALIETGTVGASRPNVNMVGSTALVAYEEEKGASVSGVVGKLVRYHAFPWNTPAQQSIVVGEGSVVIGTAGCVISDPARNARRVRILTQSPTDAGPGGIQLAFFWREGVANKGGSADTVLRRGIDGVLPGNLVPTVDAGCATSSYDEVLLLTSQRAENVSSQTPTATSANLADDTEANSVENSLAHRGVLRGPELWIGYSYVSDMNKLWMQQDNYNFWLRKYTLGVGWDSPRNVTNITDTNINVREPRIFGTPKGTTACATDPTACQNTDIVYLAWGTQTNVPPTDPEGPEDLGVWITVSTDGGENFIAPVRYSTAMGTLFQDDEAAYESQVVTRPDGTRFYGVWNQANFSTAPPTTKAEYASGQLVTVPDPAPPVTSTGGGGCAMSSGKAPFDPTLLLLAALGLGGIALRRVRRQD